MKFIKFSAIILLAFSSETPIREGLWAPGPRTSFTPQSGLLCRWGNWGQWVEVAAHGHPLGVPSGDVLAADLILQGTRSLVSGIWAAWASPCHPISGVLLHLWCFSKRQILKMPKGLAQDLSHLLHGSRAVDGGVLSQERWRHSPGLLNCEKPHRHCSQWDHVVARPALQFSWLQDTISQSH